MTPAAKLLIGSKKVCGLQWRHGPPLSSCKIWWKLNDARRREWAQRMVFSLCYSRADFLVFRPAWATRCTSQCEIWQGCSLYNWQISPWSPQAYGFTAPKTLKIWNFTNIIATKGRVLCAILTKFTLFMRDACLHNSVKFCWFISVNKCKQFTSVWVFSAKFSVISSS